MNHRQAYVRFMLLWGSAERVNIAFPLLCVCVLTGTDGQCFSLLKILVKEDGNILNISWTRSMPGLLQKKMVGIGLLLG